MTLAIGVAWLALGFVQRERAMAAQARLAESRGHLRERAAVFPTVGNTIVWRSIYRASGVLHMDRISVPWFGDASYAATASVPALDVVDAGAFSARTTRDVERFAWFSDAWLARAPEDPSLIGDARYSLRSDAYTPVWGIRLRPNAEHPTLWVNRTRQRKVRISDTLQELTGRKLEFRPIPLR